MIIDTKGMLLGFSLFELIEKIEKTFKKNVDAFEKIDIIENSKIDIEIKKQELLFMKNNEYYCILDAFKRRLFFIYFYRSVFEVAGV